MRSLMRGPVSRCGGALWGRRARVVVLKLLEFFCQDSPMRLDLQPAIAQMNDLMDAKCRANAALPQRVFNNVVKTAIGQSIDPLRTGLKEVTS